jgi:hypothetical protein
LPMDFRSHRCRWRRAEHRTRPARYMRERCDKWDCAGYIAKS